MATSSRPTDKEATPPYASCATAPDLPISRPEFCAHRGQGGGTRFDAICTRHRRRWRRRLLSAVLHARHRCRSSPVDTEFTSIGDLNLKMWLASYECLPPHDHRSHRVTLGAGQAATVGTVTAGTPVACHMALLLEAFGRTLALRAEGQRLSVP